MNSSMTIKYVQFFDRFFYDDYWNWKKFIFYDFEGPL